LLGGLLATGNSGEMNAILSLHPLA